NRFNVLFEPAVRYELWRSYNRYQVLRFSKRDGRSFYRIDIRRQMLFCRARSSTNQHMPRHLYRVVCGSRFICDRVEIIALQDGRTAKYNKIFMFCDVNDAVSIEQKVVDAMDSFNL